MASRELLHISKLNDFEKWLEEQGYMILPTSKNQYEVLRAKKDKDTVIIYCKASSKEHLSIMDKDYSLIRRFINESKKHVNADRIESMTENEIIEIIGNIPIDGKDKCYSIEQYQEAKTAAIEALEEVRQYRELGTIEELVQGKKYIDLAKQQGTVGRVIENCIAYEEIGTPEEFRAMAEKQTNDKRNLAMWQEKILNKNQ